MKVLLTGASGFVGSHVLDRLRQRNLPTVALVRRQSRRQLLAHHAGWVELREGTLEDTAALRAVVADITHVIHCAGATKALNSAGFFTVNQAGVRHLLAALPTSVERFIHLSSLAAAGPSTPTRCRSESDPATPVSAYGASKLAGEEEVRRGCPDRHVILRPPAVYGPRDGEFLRLFRTVSRRVLPRPPRQELSLVYVEDLAEAVLVALEHPSAAGKTYFVSHPERVTAFDMGSEIARQMNVRAVPLPLPKALLWVVCAASDLASRVTGKTSVMSLQKVPELVARAWTCESNRLCADTGFKCRTALSAGIAKTLAWYRENHWL